MLFGCKHIWGEVEGKYQYCEKCGKAILAPEPPCKHRWKIIKNGNITGTGDYEDENRGTWYDQICERCGEIRSHNFWIQRNGV